MDEAELDPLVVVVDRVVDVTVVVVSVVVGGSGPKVRDPSSVMVESVVVIKVVVVVREVENVVEVEDVVDEVDELVNCWPRTTWPMRAITAMLRMAKRVTEKQVMNDWTSGRKNE